MKVSNHKFPRQIIKRYRIVMAFIVLVIVFISIYSIVSIGQYISKSDEVQQIENAKEIQLGVDSWISDRVSLVEIYYGIISGLTKDDLTYTRAENKYVKIDYLKHKVDALYFGMSDGTFYTAKNWMPDASYDPRVRPWYTGAQQSNSSYIGNTYIDSDTNKTIFTVSKAFRTKDNAQGVLAIDIFMENVAAQLKQLISGTDFEAAIIDEHGVVLHYTGDAYLTGQAIEAFQSNKVFLLYKQYQTRQPIKPLLELQNKNLVKIDAISRTPWTLLIFTNDKNTLSTAENELQQYFLLLALLSVFALSSLLLYERTIKLINDLQSVQEQSRPEIDFLTKVFSRSYFDEKLESFWELGTKHKQPLAILLIDVDHFRKYFNRYGQSEADQLLVKLSREIQKNIEPRHVIARYGGNVFAVICYQMDEAHLTQLAGELVDTIEALGIVHLETEKEIVTVSIGAVSIVPSENLSVGRFIHMGFTALMEAKQAGRNTVHISH